MYTTWNFLFNKSFDDAKLKPEIWTSTERALPIEKIIIVLPSLHGLAVFLIIRITASLLVQDF